MKTCILNRVVSLKKQVAGIVVFGAVLSSCNNNQLVQQYKTLHEHDSLLLVQTQADDSTIKGYMHNLNDIQSNLDNIKAREKIVTAHGNETGGNTTLGDIKMIDSLIIASHREIANLHSGMKKLKQHNSEMETMVEEMSHQISAQDSQITTLQTNLTNVNASYKAITEQFNDTMTVLQSKNVRIENMTNTMNTVYYAIGTIKELKDNNVIDKTGGFIGIGRNSELKPDFNSSYFTKTDLTKLQVIPLNAKFKKLLSNHPTNSYKITGDKTADSLWITNQSSFWSENKYLIVVVK